MPQHIQCMQFIGGNKVRGTRNSYFIEYSVIK
jgi:hypothetical protein